MKFIIGLFVSLLICSSWCFGASFSVVNDIGYDLCYVQLDNFNNPNLITNLNCIQNGHSSIFNGGFYFYSDIEDFNLFTSASDPSGFYSVEFKENYDYFADVGWHKNLFIQGQSNQGFNWLSVDNCIVYLDDEKYRGNFYWKSFTDTNFYLVNENDGSKILSSSSLEDKHMPKINFLKENRPDILEKNYYMKAFAYIELSNGIITEYVLPEGIEDKYYIYNHLDYNTYSAEAPTIKQLKEQGGSYFEAYQKLKNEDGKLPYILLKPEYEDYGFNETKNEKLAEYEKLCQSDLDYCGEFTVTYNVLPIDGKCAISGPGKMDAQAVAPKSEKQKMICRDLDNNGVCDILKVEDTFKCVNPTYEIVSGHENLMYKLKPSDYPEDNNILELEYIGKDIGYCEYGYSYDAIDIPFDGLHHSEDDACQLSKMPYFFQNIYVDLGGKSYAQIKQTCDYKQFDIDQNNKIVCDNDLNNCQLITGEAISLNQPNTNNIKVNGVKESPKSNEIAMQAYKLARYHNVTQTQDFINEITDTTSQVSIEKTINYDQNIDKTTINIKINTNGLKQLALLQIIPKPFASSIEDIKTIKSNAKQNITIDKDPVIGWYFEDEGEYEVEYQVPGANEGGTIIVTRNPILYNQGYFTVNYRETPCQDNEYLAFELDDIENSNVYQPNSNKTFKVCLSHVDDYDLNSGSKSQNLFSYNANEVSITPDLINKVTLSTDNTNLNWGLKQQKDSPGEQYSCIGSIKNNKFGDCIFSEENRIWVALGEDFEPPVTSINIPYLSSSTRFELEAEDASGILKTEYCIGENCVPNLEYTEPVFVECENSQAACVIQVSYRSTDTLNNQETIKHYSISLLAEGSSCEADCTGQPNPSRIVKDCHMKNGCQFFGNNQDEIEATQTACHYRTVGYWAQLNDTHQVQCPAGPVRKSVFTNEKIDYFNSYCDDLRTVKYPVRLNGEQVNMVIIYCHNY